MRHRVAHRKLGRVTEHRIALLRNQATNLLRHEHLETTVPKAKELRPFVERLISVAKRGLAGADGPASIKALNARRMVMRDVQDREVVGKLFETIAPRFESRPGGYTRILRLGFRRGDAAEVAQIELVGSEFDPKAKAKSDAAAKGEDAAPKTTGVAGRLRAAAQRLRGKKDAGESTENEAVPKRGRGKGGPPK